MRDKEIYYGFKSLSLRVIGYTAVDNQNKEIRRDLAVFFFFHVRIGFGGTSQTEADWDLEMSLTPTVQKRQPD